MLHEALPASLPSETRTSRLIRNRASISTPVSRIIIVTSSFSDALQYVIGRTMCLRICHSQWAPFRTPKSLESVIPQRAPEKIILMAMDSSLMISTQRLKFSPKYTLVCLSAYWMTRLHRAIPKDLVLVLYIQQLFASQCFLVSG